MHHKIAQLAINNPYHSQKSGEIFIQNDTVAARGDLLMLIEINSNKSGEQNLIENILSIAYQAYEQSVLHQPEQVLENILQQLNLELPRLPVKNLNLYTNLNCFVGILADSELFFATYGKVKTFLIKPTAIKNIGNRAERSDKKIFFDSTLSGQLKSGDSFLIANESVTDYLSLEKIKKIVSTLPPQSAVAHLNNILEAAAETVCFFAIVFQMLQSQETNKNEIASPVLGKLVLPAGSKKSLDQMLRVQSDTEKILKPAGLITALKNQIKSNQPESKEAPEQEKIARPRISAPILVKRDRPRPPFKFSFNLEFIKKIPEFTIKILKIISLLSPKKIYQDASGWLAQNFSLLIKKFSALNKARKTTVIAGAVILLIFSQSLIWQGKVQSTLKSKQDYQNLIGQITDLQNSIQASLIYHDLNRAKELLANAETLAQTLPQNNADKIKKYQEIKSSLDKTFDEVWNIVKIPSPVSLVNFKELIPDADIAILAYQNNFIYGLGNNNSQIIAQNTKDNKAKILSNFNATIKAAGVLDNKGDLLIASTDKKIYKLNGENYQEVQINMPPELKDMDAMVFYNNNMYILDRQNSKIFKIGYYNGSFNGAQTWNKENLPLDQTAALAIDGTVFTLQRDGSILKLVKGKSAGFPTINLVPGLNDPVKLWTSDSTNNLYILDPKNKRLAVINKEGQSIGQYVSDKFNNLKDFVIRESEKKAYLLNDNEVFVVALQ